MICPLNILVSSYFYFFFEILTLYSCCLRRLWLSDKIIHQVFLLFDLPGMFVHFVTFLFVCLRSLNHNRAFVETICAKLNQNRKDLIDENKIGGRGRYDRHVAFIFE